MSSFACENIHQGQERINDESRGRKQINLWLASLLCDQLLPIREWKCQDINQVLHHGRCFLSSASSSTEKPGQNRSCYEQFKMCIVFWSESLNCEIKGLVVLSHEFFARGGQQSSKNLCSLWRIIRPLSHTLCPSVCSLRQMNWKHVNRSSKRTMQMKTSSKIKTFRNTNVLVLWQSQLRLETVCA